MPKARVLRAKGGKLLHVLRTGVRIRAKSSGYLRQISLTTLLGTHYLLTSPQSLLPLEIGVYHQSSTRLL